MRLKNRLTTICKEFVDFLMPRTCAACGQRLAIGEEVICGMCSYDLPRTYYWLKPKDNELAQLFWIQIPVERAAALFFYKAHTLTSRIIYKLKYFDRPDVGVKMGRMAASEFILNGFFDDIDCIIPVPLTRARQKERGYNQSEMIARGVSNITGIPIVTDIVQRTTFSESQTQKDRWERMDNVGDVFVCAKDIPERYHHILIVDDVITTGATIIGCASALVKVGVTKISVMSLGYARPL